MRPLLSIFVAGLWMVAAAGPWHEARGGSSASAVATVTVTVRPTVSIEAAGPGVDLGAVPVGEFPATVMFRVRSNSPSVAMYVCATPLHREADSSGTAADAIGLARDRGVVVSCTAGDSSGGGSQRVAYSGPSGPTDAGELHTETFTVPGASGQETYVTVTWVRDDPAQAAGCYRARVALVALAMPE